MKAFVVFQQSIMQGKQEAIFVIQISIIILLGKGVHRSHGISKD